MSLQRKQEVYAVACEYDLLIMEDDPYYILQFRNGSQLTVMLINCVCVCVCLLLARHGLQATPVSMLSVCKFSHVVGLPACYAVSLHLRIMHIRAHLLRHARRGGAGAAEPREELPEH
jgi:hypothetical protein